MCHVHVDLRHVLYVCTSFAGTTAVIYIHLKFKWQLYGAALKYSWALKQRCCGSSRNEGTFTLPPGHLLEPDALDVRYSVCLCLLPVYVVREFGLLVLSCIANPIWSIVCQANGQGYISSSS